MLDVRAAALRETRVLLAALSSVVVLRGRFDRVRLIASTCLVAGIPLLTA